MGVIGRKVHPRCIKIGSQIEGAVLKRSRRVIQYVRCRGIESCSFPIVPPSGQDDRRSFVSWRVRRRREEQQRAEATTTRTGTTMTGRRQTRLAVISYVSAEY